jgi:hypothetical protein
VKWLERAVVRSAAKVIVNSRELQDALEDRYPGTTVSWIPNGTDLERMPQRVAPALPGLHVVYAGTLYGGRDLSPVVQAMRMIIECDPEAQAAPLKLTVAGDATRGHEAQLREAIRSAGMSSNVELLGLIATDRALELVASASLAVVLAQDQDLQVPAKLYETAAIGVPTLVVCEHTCASAREAERLGVLVREPDDIAGIADVLKAARRGALPLTVAGEEVSYAALAQSMGRLLGKVAGIDPFPPGDTEARPSAGATSPQVRERAGQGRG